MTRMLAILLLLASCDSAEDAARKRFGGGVHCMDHGYHTAICWRGKETFVCFADVSDKTALCLPAVDPITLALPEQP